MTVIEYMESSQSIADVLQIPIALSAFFGITGTSFILARILPGIDLGTFRTTTLVKRKILVPMTGMVLLGLCIGLNFPFISASPDPVMPTIIPEPVKPTIIPEPAGTPTPSVPKIARKITIEEYDGPDNDSKRPRAAKMGVAWLEAQNYCERIGGRIPTASERKENLNLLEDANSEREWLFDGRGDLRSVIDKDGQITEVNKRRGHENIGFRCTT